MESPSTGGRGLLGGPDTGNTQMRAIQICRRISTLIADEQHGELEMSAAIQSASRIGAEAAIVWTDHGFFPETLLCTHGIIPCLPPFDN